MAWVCKGRLALILVIFAQASWALHVGPARCAPGVLRMRGGSSVGVGSGDDKGSESHNALKESAARRLKQAKAAGKSAPIGFGKTLSRMLFSISNRLGVTGSSTRVVNGKIVLSRNPVQKFFYTIFLILRAIFLFFKTLFVPMKNLDIVKPSSGPGRGSFSNTNKKREMRMADLPPMPGG